MKRKNVFLSAILITAMFAVVLSSCKKDPTDFTLSDMVSGSIKLNGSTPATTVPVKPAIVVTFNTEIDVATAIPANVSLIQDYDKAVIPVTVTASGKTITVTPIDDLSFGAVYELKLSAGLKSTGGLAMTAASRTFTTITATSFTLTAIVAGTIDMNGATSPNNVPVKPSITATFNSLVDAATLDQTTITLVQDYDKTSIDCLATSVGKTITITPLADIANGALYKLSFTAGIKSSGGLALTATSRTFTTVGTFVPNGSVAYWNFEGDANDQVGAFDPPASGVVAITYTASRNALAGKAATFDGATSIIEVPNGDVLMNTANFTLSFWVKTNTTGHLDGGGNQAGFFVMGLAAFKGFQFELSADCGSAKLAAQYDLGDGTTGSEDLWFNGEGQTKDNGGWQGWDFCKDLRNSGGLTGIAKDKWMQVVCIYNASEKSGKMYLNGEKMKSQNFNLWPEGDAKRNVTGLKYSGVAPETVNELAFGFIQSRAGTLWDNEPWGGYDFPTSNHFKGQLDDIRIFHKALTDTEIQLMYNSEK